MKNAEPGQKLYNMEEQDEMWREWESKEGNAVA